MPAAQWAAPAALALTCTAFVPPPAAAQAPAGGPSAAAETRPAAPTARDTVAVDSTLPPPAAPHRAGRLLLHGYLTQGYAGLHGGVQFYGIRDRASADFRYAALQGRYALTTADHLVLQLSHRELGRSPISHLEPEVKPNWAFYEHAFGDGTTIKAGRSPIPRGIYNQLRSVGVALPTYRPPVVFYDEGAYYSETIDGLVASRTFLAERPWSVDAHAYAGQWSSLVYDTWSDAYSVQRVRARRAVGGQLWLNTPADGVRVGAAAQRYQYDDNAVLGPAKMKEYHVSLDATRERGFVRTEVQLQNYGLDKFYSGYTQLGARLAGKLHGVVEFQRSYDTDVKYGGGTLPSSYAWHRSDGVGLSYAFAPTLVAKAEHHWDRGVQLEQSGVPLNPPRFRYAIASLSASF